MAGKEFPLSVVIKAVDKLTAPMRGIQSKILKFDATLRATGRGVSDKLGLPVLGAAAGKLGGALGQLGKKLAWIAGGLGAVTAAAGYAAWSIVQGFADAGSRLNDLSIQLGINAETLQEWTFAAKQTGLEAEEFDQAMRILSKNLGNAFVAKKGPVFNVLQGMKIRLRDSNGQMRQTESLLPEIADGLARIKSPALRASAAAAIFGRAGVKLLPMLDGGSEGLRKFAARARELGIVISADSVKAADDFGDSMDQLKDSVAGARNTIGTQLLPVINKMVAQLTDFIVQNRPKIEAFFKDFAAQLPGRINTAIKFLGDLRTAFQPVLNVIALLSEKFGGANVALGALAGVLAVTLIPSLYATATAIYAVGVALLTTPVGWIIAGIAAIVGLMIWLYSEFETARVIIYAVGSAAVWFIKNMTPIGILITKWDEMADAIKTVRDFLTDLWQGMKAGFSMAIGWVMDLANAMLNLVPDWVKNLFGAGGKTININASGPSAVGGGPSAASVARGMAPPRQEVAVKVDMSNLPPGTRVSTETRGAPDFELSRGYAMGGGH